MCGVTILVHFGDRLSSYSLCVRCCQAWKEVGYCKENLTVLLILFEVSLSKHWEREKEMKGAEGNELYTSNISFTIHFIKRY